MIGLIIKDFCCVKSSLRLSLSLIALWCAVFFLAGRGDIVVAMISAVLVLVLLSTSFILDQQSKWEGYALAMPFTRRDLVQGKYLTGLLLGLAGLLLSLLMGAAVMLLSESSMTEVALISFAGLLIAVIYTALSLPFVYRFGAQKGSFIMSVVFVFIYGPASRLMMCGRTQDFLLWVEAQPPARLALSLAAAAALAYYLSYRVSLAVFAKKEF